MEPIRNFDELLEIAKADDNIFYLSPDISNDASQRKNTRTSGVFLKQPSSK